MITDYGDWRLLDIHGDDGLTALLVAVPTVKEVELISDLIDKVREEWYKGGTDSLDIEIRYALEQSNIEHNIIDTDFGIEI